MRHGWDATKSVSKHSDTGRSSAEASQVLELRAAVGTLYT